MSSSFDREKYGKGYDGFALAASASSESPPGRAINVDIGVITGNAHNEPMFSPLRPMANISLHLCPPQHASCDWTRALPVEGGRIGLIQAPQTGSLESWDTNLATMRDSKVRIRGAATACELRKRSTSRSCARAPRCCRRRGRPAPHTVRSAEVCR